MMERNGYYALLAAFVLVCLALSGCGGGGSGNPNPPGAPLTAEQIAQIEQSSNAISARLVGAADPASDAALQNAKALAQTLSAVQSANIIEGNLVVQYKGAGQEVWATDDALPTPPADIAELETLSRRVAASRAAASPVRSPVGNRKAVLMNALSEDPAFAGTVEAFSWMKDLLQAAGFDVIDLQGAQVTPDRLRSLADCSLFVELGHGGWQTVEGDQAYAVQTGKAWSSDVSLSDWKDGQIVKVWVPWGPGGKVERLIHSRSFCAVTGRFWKDAYARSHLNRALFFNCACSGAKDGAFRRCLYDIGVVAYSGWTDVQTKAYYTAWRTLAVMADGKTLRQAVDALPDWYKSDTYDGKTATLWYGPDDEGSVTLGGVNQTHPEIIIDAPFDGETITDRECTVRGIIMPRAGFSYATISVNGQSEALSVDGEGRFEQPVGLRSGSNTIRISTIGHLEHGEQISINGEFSSDILYTTLWWNTHLNDIDLHLVPVEGAGGATDECYYANQSPFWGAALDVDDVDGFGPEHITARSLPPGKYKLYVHYYDTHGQTEPASVNVAVSVNGQPSRVFSLGGGRRMTVVGDVWSVCTIEFPSGSVAVLDSFVPAARSGSVLRLPRK